MSVPETATGSLPSDKLLCVKLPCAKFSRLKALSGSIRALGGLPRLFWIPATLVLLLLLAALTQADGLTLATNRLNVWVYQYFGTFYLWFVAAVLLACLGLAFSPLGKIKLGRPDEKPAFNFFSWFSMLFCAGMGTGFMFWGGAEPLYHYLHPPLIAEKLVEGAAAPNPAIEAFAYTFFHWGLSPWAIYAMTALATGFFCFNRQQELRFSAFFNFNKVQRLGVDLIAMLAFVFGIAATFGMGVLIIEGGLQTLLGVQPGPWIKIAVIVAITVVFLFSAYRGLHRGIQWLSNTSMSLTILLVVCLFCLGPRQEIFSAYWDGGAQYLKSLPQMSLGLGHFHQADWVREWTVKYWSWWIAWAPFVGVFIALISRGRSIRQLIAGVILVPTIFSCLWFATMGQAAISLHQAGGFGSMVLNFDNVQTIWYRLMNAYSHSIALSILSLVMIAVFICDSADSACYTMACLSKTGKLPMDETDSAYEPGFGLTLAWGLLFALLTGILLLAGGMQILQEITTITVLPFTVLLMCIFIKFFAVLRREPAAIASDCVAQSDSTIQVDASVSFCQQKNPVASPEAI